MNGSVYIIDKHFKEEVHLGTVAEVLEAPTNTLNHVSRGLVLFIADVLSNMVDGDVSWDEADLSLEIR